MASDGSPEGLHGSFELCNAPDEHIDTPHFRQNAVQIMQIDLARDTVKDMRRAARAGKTISLGFGKHLYLRYGHTSKPLRSRATKFHEEVYYKEPIETDEHEDRLTFEGLVTHHLAAEVEAKQNGASSASAALDKMREQYAAINQEKKANETTIRDDSLNPMRDKRLKANHFNHVNSSSPRLSAHPSLAQPSSSRPTSAAAATLSSPLDPTSAIAQAQRFALIHLLAIHPLYEATVRTRTCIPPEPLLKLLDSVAEKSGSGAEGVWTLSSKRYRDLDVWNFPYTSEDRQLAIDNAIHALDKLRLNPQDKLWQRLLPKTERNKGKTLSRLSQFPTDHRKLLSGLDGKSQSRPSSPKHSQGEASDTEAMASTHPLQQKENGILASQRKTKVEKAEKPKGKVGSKTPVSNNKKRRVLSDEIVHSSDDDSLPPPSKQARTETIGSKAKPGNFEQHAEQKNELRKNPLAQASKRPTADRNTSASKVPGNTSKTASHEMDKQTETAPSVKKTLNHASQSISPIKNDETRPKPSNEARKAVPPVPSEKVVTKQQPSKNVTPTKATGNASRPGSAAKPSDKMSRPPSTSSAQPSLKKENAAKTSNNIEKTTTIKKAHDLPKDGANTNKNVKSSKETSNPAKRPAEPVTPETWQNSKPTKRPKLSSPDEFSPLSSAHSSTARPSSSISNTATAKKPAPAPPSKPEAPSKPSSQTQAKKDPSEKRATAQPTKASSKLEPSSASRPKPVDGATKPSAASNKNADASPKIEPPNPGDKLVSPKPVVKGNTQSTTKPSPSKPDRETKEPTQAATSSAKGKMAENEQPKKQPTTSSKPIDSPKANLAPAAKSTPTKATTSSKPTDSPKSNPAPAAKSTPIKPTTKLTEAKSGIISTSTPEPLKPTATDDILTRRQALDSYKKYHTYFAAYQTSFAEAKEAAEPPDSTAFKNLQAQFKALDERQNAILKSFSAMLEEFKLSSDAIPDEVERAGPGELCDDDRKVSADDVRERMQGCFTLYDRIMHNFGVVPPAEVDKLWEDLDAIKVDQRKVLRVNMFGGEKGEGNGEAAGGSKNV